MVNKEYELDRLFASRTIDHPSLEIITHNIGQIRARIRLNHLAAHLAQTSILSPEQIKLYDEIRGYNSAQAHHNHEQHQN